MVQAHVRSVSPSTSSGATAAAASAASAVPSAGLAVPAPAAMDTPLAFASTAGLRPLRLGVSALAGAGGGGGAGGRTCPAAVSFAPFGVFGADLDETASLPMNEAGRKRMRMRMRIRMRMRRGREEEERLRLNFFLHI